VSRVRVVERWIRGAVVSVVPTGVVYNGGCGDGGRETTTRWTKRGQETKGFEWAGARAAVAFGWRGFWPCWARPFRFVRLGVRVVWACASGQSWLMLYFLLGFPMTPPHSL
jgi:hypothetical protein